MKITIIVVAIFTILGPSNFIYTGLKKKKNTFKAFKNIKKEWPHNLAITCSTVRTALSQKNKNIKYGWVSVKGIGEVLAQDNCGYIQYIDPYRNVLEEGFYYVKRANSTNICLEKMDSEGHYLFEYQPGDSIPFNKRYYCTEKKKYWLEDSSQENGLQ